MPITNTHALMDGVRKFILSGAVPALKNVVFKEGQAACTDGDTIYLPTPDAMGNEDSHTLWLYKAEHELGHEDPVNAPHWKTVMEGAGKLDPLTKQIWNLLSDHVQERNRIGTFAGRDDVLRKGRALFIAGQMDKTRHFPVSGFGALFQWDNRCRMAWNPLLTKEWDDPANEDFIAKAAALVDISALKNEHDCLAAARLLRPLFPEDSTEEAKKEEEQASEMGASIHADGEDDGKPAEAAGKGTPRKVKSRMSYHARVPEWIDVDAPLSPYSKYYKEQVDAFMTRNSLPARLKAWLVGKRMVREATGYRSGRLDTARLGAVLRNREDVFRRREESRAVNAAVFLLVDASGSMSGSRYSAAVASALMLCDALSAAKASVRVECFTELHDGRNYLAHGLVKDWNERYVYERAAHRACAVGAKLCDNADGESILWAYNCLRQQRADKKLLVVLSDGEPAAYGPVTLADGAGAVDVLGFTQDAIRLVEADKSIKLVGVGIDGASVHMYKNKAFANSGTNLSSTLLDIAKSVYE